MEWDRRAEVLRLRRHREGFSRLGWALTAQMAVMLAAQTLLLLLAPDPLKIQRNAVHPGRNIDLSPDIRLEF